MQPNRILKDGVKPRSLKIGILAKKRANPFDRIHHFKLRYNLDIQSGFGSGFYQIMAVKLKLPFLKKSEYHRF
jgi:hypothetical protein